MLYLLAPGGHQMVGRFVFAEPLLSSSIGVEQMANSLKREIETGEVVIIKAKMLKSGLKIDERAFVCDDGFGMSDRTSGTALHGFWLDGTGWDRMEGTRIDAKATGQFQKKWGKFAENHPMKQELNR